MYQDQRRDLQGHNLNSESQQQHCQWKSLELKPKNELIKPIINNIGHWSTRENMKYYAFLKKFSNKFGERQSRRQWKVFKALSKFVKTRNANQCRSHHHKMNRNFSTIRQTLSFLSSRQPQLEEKYHKYSVKLDFLEKTLFRDTIQQHSYSNEKEHPINWQPSFKQTGANSSNLRTQFDEKNALKTQNIITAASYEDQDNLRNLKTPNSLLCEPSLNQRLVMVPEHQTMGYQNQYFHAQNFSCPGMMSIQSARQQYQRKILDCHSLFIKWITKTEQLVKISKTVPINSNTFYYC